MRKSSKTAELLEAAKVALDKLPNIASMDTIQGVPYHEVRMRLFLAIERFEEGKKT